MQTPETHQGLEQQPTAPPGTARHRQPPARRFTLSRLSLKYGLVSVFTLMTVGFWVLLPAFGSMINIWVILESMAIVVVAALGVTFSLAVGGWDLSIGSNISFVVMVGAICLVEFNTGALVALVACLASGLAIGALNALLIVKGKVPDMIATLGTMFVFQGLALVIAGGNNIAPGMTLANGRTAPGGMGAILNWIGNGTIGFGIPGLVVILLLTAVVVFVVLELSRFGRTMYALGLNREAARLAGIPVNRYRAAAYLLSGLLGGVAGIMLLGLLGNGQVNAGSPYLLECVAAALIAYAFLGLKRPSVQGTVFGALFVSVVINGLTMFNVPYYAEDTTYGLLLMLALILTFAVGEGNPAAGSRRLARRIQRREPPKAVEAGANRRGAIAGQGGSGSVDRSSLMESAREEEGTRDDA